MKRSPSTPLPLSSFDRRELLRLLGVAGVVHSAALLGCAPASPPPVVAGTAKPGPPRVIAPEPFVFLQLSDTHWGYSGAANPEAQSTLRSTIATINQSSLDIDFVVFTGDLTHTTPDPVERARRMKEFQSIVAELRVPTRYYLPGEHDADQDGGAAFREHFGETHRSFDHKGVHFLTLDNVSDPGKIVGPAQLDWLRRDLAQVPKSTPVVVFAHRPLFELMPAWDWTTSDGAAVIDVLATHPNVTVFYGHIHQEHHFKTGNIEHHAARSLIFPLPAPGSVPKKAPLPWDAAAADHGIGYRSVREQNGAPAVTERAPGSTPTGGVSG